MVFLSMIPRFTRRQPAVVEDGVIGGLEGIFADNPELHDNPFVADYVKHKPHNRLIADRDAAYCPTDPFGSMVVMFKRLAESSRYCPSRAALETMVAETYPLFTQHLRKAITGPDGAIRWDLADRLNAPGSAICYDRNTKVISILLDDRFSIQL